MRSSRKCGVLDRACGAHQILPSLRRLGKHASQGLRFAEHACISKTVMHEDTYDAVDVHLRIAETYMAAGIAQANVPALRAARGRACGGRGVSAQGPVTTV
jgi:hypothetical protein